MAEAIMRSVAIGEMVASNAADEVLVAYGLGSCVAVCLYDPMARVGGMVHSLLPTILDSGSRDGGASGRSRAKFVDQGVPLLVEALTNLGASRSRLVAQVCGGADVLSLPGADGALSIGERNVLAAEAALQSAGLRVKARATGGKSGRTVRFYIADGRVTVRCLGQSEQPVDWSDVVQS